MAVNGIHLQASLFAMLICQSIFAADSAGMAQGGRPAAPASVARIAPRDLTGLWSPAGLSGVSPTGITTSPPTKLGRQMMEDNKPGDGPRRVTDIGEINDPHTTVCDPNGFPRMLLFEFRQVQIVQTPNQILMLYSYDQRWRSIWMDGRKLPATPSPRWFGYSVGRWENDSTLVVETNGTTERSWLDNAGNPHSADMRVTERYTRIDADNMELTVTIDDPVSYTTPFNARDKLKLQRLPADTMPQELVCVSSDAASYQQIMSAPALSK